jgi:hypothetical protein
MVSLPPAGRGHRPDPGADWGGSWAKVTLWLRPFDVAREVLFDVAREVAEYVRLELPDTVVANELTVDSTFGDGGPSWRSRSSSSCRRRGSGLLPHLPPPPTDVEAGRSDRCM